MDRGKLVEGIYDEYQGFMYHIALEILKDRFLAEDVVHECVVRLMKAKALEIDFISAPSTKSLVRIVATNESIRQYHKQQKKRFHTDSIDENKLIVTAEHGWRIEIEEFLDSLPGIYKDTFILRIYYGYEYETVGRLLAIRPQTAKNRMVKLRKLIEKYWIGGEAIVGKDRKEDRVHSLQIRGK